MSKSKKLLTLDDLYNFYFSQDRNCTFSAKELGYQVSVQIPAQFKVEKKENDGTLLFCKVKLMHSGQNRNHSSVTDKALRKAAKHLAYKPILANFMEYEDEDTGEILKDFTSHDIEFNEDGSVSYIEKQIGCFTSDEPFFEIEEETGHNFLYGYCAIPREYTDACSVIERKGGTKVSVELGINEMKYNSRSKVLELTDVTIMGATCLGKNPKTLDDIGEGMQNARLDIADFSTKNNSLFTNYDSTLIEIQERLSKLESTCFNIKYDSKEGGNEENMTKFEELCQKYSKTIDDITFDYENMSDEELVEAFSNAFDEDTSVDGEVDEQDNSDTQKDTPSVDESTLDDQTNSTTESGEEKDSTLDEKKSDSSIDDTPKKKVENSIVNTIEVSYSVNGEVKKFAVSLQEKIYSIQELVNSTYAEQDNTYYGVSVYEDYVVMQDYWNGRYFKQTYSDENDTYSLTGDRVEVFAEFVTADEQKELESMRSNYAALVEYKANAEKNELHMQREAILADEKYSVLSENEAFAELQKNMDNYSLEDLEKEAKVIFADHVASVGTFALNDEKKQTSKKLFGNPNTKKSKASRYGDLFRK